MHVPVQRAGVAAVLFTRIAVQQYCFLQYYLVRGRSTARHELTNTLGPGTQVFLVVLAECVSMVGILHQATKRHPKTPKLVR